MPGLSRTRASSLPARPGSDSPPRALPGCPCHPPPLRPLLTQRAPAHTAAPIARACRPLFPSYPVAKGSSCTSNLEDAKQVPPRPGDAKDSLSSAPGTQPCPKQPPLRSSERNATLPDAVPGAPGFSRGKRGRPHRGAHKSSRGPVSFLPVTRLQCDGHRESWSWRRVGPWLLGPTFQHHRKLWRHN